MADKPAYRYDVRTTALRLLGIDHKRVTGRHNGIDRRLRRSHPENYLVKRRPATIYRVPNPDDRP